MRRDNPDGPLLGSCAIEDTGGWDRYRTFACNLTNLPGTQGICLIPRGGSGELLRLDWLSFAADAKP